MKTSTWLLAALAAVGPAWVCAQTSTSVASPASDATSSVVAPESDTTAAIPAVTLAIAAEECCRIPAGAAVELEIAQALSSAAQKRGDKFAIRLQAPLLHAGAVVIPAGTVGVGEIVHADRSHGGGKPGELLLAARYLEFDGAQIPLRALKFGGQGQDKTKVALGVSMAIGPLAHFIRGKEIEIPAGTIVTAKLAQDFLLPSPSSDQSHPSASTAAQQE
jgi:hypothetical protein